MNMDRWYKNFTVRLEFRFFQGFLFPPSSWQKSIKA